MDESTRVSLERTLGRRRHGCAFGCRQVAAGDGGASCKDIPASATEGALGMMLLLLQLLLGHAKPLSKEKNHTSNTTTGRAIWPYTVVKYK